MRPRDGSLGGGTGAALEVRLGMGHVVVGGVVSMDVMDGFCTCWICACSSGFQNRSNGILVTISSLVVR